MPWNLRSASVCVSFRSTLACGTCQVALRKAREGKADAQPTFERCAEHTTTTWEASWKVHTCRYASDPPGSQQSGTCEYSKPQKDCDTGA